MKFRLRGFSNPGEVCRQNEVSDDEKTNVAGLGVLSFRVSGLGFRHAPSDMPGEVHGARSGAYRFGDFNSRARSSQVQGLRI